MLSAFRKVHGLDEERVVQYFDGNGSQRRAKRVRENGEKDVS